MKLRLLFLCAALSACGFKGDLYLPQDEDNATFSPVQTGVGLKPPASVKTQPEQNLEGNQNVE